MSFKPSFIRLLEKIEQKYPSPTSSETPESSTARTRSTTSLEESFPPEWIVDSTAVREAIKSLERAYQTAISTPTVEDPFARRGLRRSNNPEEQPEPSTGSTTNPPTEDTSPSKNKGRALQPSVERDSQEGEEEPLSGTATPTNPERLFTGSPVYETRPTTSGSATAMASSNQLPATITLTNEQFEALIDRAMNGARQGRPAQAQANEAGMPINDGAIYGTTKHFKARDIGFFDPDIDSTAVETKDYGTVYHNVFSFTNRVKVKGNTVDDAAFLRQNLDTCLSGKAERWYTEELDDLRRSGLRNDPNGVEAWCKALEARFREAPGKALARLETLRYTVKDARNNRDPEDYIQQIIVNGKNAGTAVTEYAQVLTAYEHMDPELRVMLPMPTDATTVNDFINQVSLQKTNWFDLYKTYGSSQGQTSRDRGGYSKPKFPPRGGFQSPYPNYGYPIGNRFPSFDRGGFPYGGGRGAYNGGRGQGFQPFQFQRNVEPPSNIKQEFKQEIKPQQAGKAPERGSRYTGQDRPRMDQYRNDQRQRYGNERRPPYQPYQRNQPYYRPYQKAYLAEGEEPWQDQTEGEAYEEYENGYYENDAYWQSDGLEDERASPEEVTEEDNTVEAHFAMDVSPKIHSCKRCKAIFDSNNKLHKHLRAKCQGETTLSPNQESTEVTTALYTIPESTIVRSTAVEVGTKKGYGFRGWRYATTEAKIGALVNKAYQVCLDTGCTMSLIDRQFLLEQCPGVTIYDMASPMEVRGIGSASHNASQFVLVSIYLLGRDRKIALIEREVHIVDNLKVNLLVGMDILAPEGILIDLENRLATIRSCESIQLPLTIESRSSKVDRTIFSEYEQTVQPHTRALLTILGAKGSALELPQDRDLLFEPDCLDQLSVFAHLVDHTMEAVYVQNDTDSPVLIPRNTRVGNVVEYEADGCFAVSCDNGDLAAKPPKRLGWIKQGLKAFLATAAVFHTTKEPETILPNGVTVYGQGLALTKLSNVVTNNPKVWEDHGNIAKVPEEEWMDIPLLDDWQEQYKPGQARVYPVGQQDREVIDKAFDKLHGQDRMEWTKEATPFTYPCFVVWKGVGTTRKGRVVIDIRGVEQDHDARRLSCAFTGRHPRCCPWG